MSPQVYPSDFFQLRYRDTEDAIRLGDFVTYRHMLGFRRIPGRVYYIPGVSRPHREMGYGDSAAFWSILLEGGVVVSWLYVPKDPEVRASARLHLVKRTDDQFSGLSPDEEVGLGVEEEEADPDRQRTTRGM